MGKVLPAALEVFSPLMNMVVGSCAGWVFCSGMGCLRRGEGEGGGGVWLLLCCFVLLLLA
jgi:hypothetical protein